MKDGWQIALLHFLSVTPADLQTRSKSVSYTVRLSITLVKIARLPDYQHNKNTAPGKMLNQVRTSMKLGGNASGWSRADGVRAPVPHPPDLQRKPHHGDAPLKKMLNQVTALHCCRFELLTTLNYSIKTRTTYVRFGLE